MFSRLNKLHTEKEMTQNQTLRNMNIDRSQQGRLAFICNVPFMILPIHVGKHPGCCTYLELDQGSQVPAAVHLPDLEFKSRVLSHKGRRTSMNHVYILDTFASRKPIHAAFLIPNKRICCRHCVYIAYSSFQFLAFSQYSHYPSQFPS